MDRNGSCGPEPAARLRAGRDRRILEAVESVMAGRKRKSAPSGEEFMDGAPADDIRKVLKAEQKSGGHAKAVLILLACPCRREGETGGAIAQRLGGSTGTVYGWLSRMRRGGLDARYDKAKPGRPRKIGQKLHGRVSDVIDGQPEGCGIKSAWTGRLILIMLSGVFGINGISPSTAYGTMHRMGKPCKKPDRPFDQRAPSGEAREKFKIDLGRKIADAAATGPDVFWVGESHFSAKTIRGMAWLTQDLSTLRRIKPCGKRYTCFAALGIGGLLHHRYYDRGNTEHMTEFVTSIYEAYGKVVLITGNASHHKSKELMENLKKFDGAVRMIYLPPCSPDLNPVETAWKGPKKYTANGVYKRTEDMAGATDEMIRTGTVMLPPAPGYALDAVEQGMAAAA